MLQYALKFVDRREKARARGEKCRACGDEQIQLVDWTTFRDRLLYKCRVCGHRFEVYDGFSK